MCLFMSVCVCVYDSWRYFTDHKASFQGCHNFELLLNDWLYVKDYLYFNMATKTNISAFLILLKYTNEKIKS